MTLLVKVLFRYRSNRLLSETILGTIYGSEHEMTDLKFEKNRDLLYFSFGKYHLSIRKVRELICDLNSHRFVTSNLGGILMDGNKLS